MQSPQIVIAVTMVNPDTGEVRVQSYQAASGFGFGLEQAEYAAIECWDSDFPNEIEVIFKHGYRDGDKNVAHFERAKPGG